jgi:hypothetical protein
MADTTLLRSSAIVRNSSIGTSPPAAPRGPVKTGELPLVQVKMGPGGPQVLTPQPKPVEILPPRDADSALATGGLPRINVKMTSRGPQPDDGRDSPVMILPPKDQKHAVAVGGLPMAQLRATSASPQIQSLPNVRSAGPQIQAPPPALSQPRPAGFAAAPLGHGPQRGAGFAVAPSGQARVFRVAAPTAAPVPVPLPPMPEIPADQLMLCRYLVGKYLVDLSATEIAVPATQSTDDAQRAESSAPADSATAKGVSDNVNLAEATIATIEQALVAVALRAEAEAAAAIVQESPELLEEAVVPVRPTASAASIIPVAPTASYVAGRVHGYGGGRVQRNGSMAPRRVPRPGALPPVIVKMENGRSVVQNQAEVAAVRAAIAAQGAYVPEGAPSESTDVSAQG